MTKTGECVGNFLKILLDAATGAQKSELKMKWKKFEAIALSSVSMRVCVCAFFYPQRGETYNVIHKKRTHHPLGNPKKRVATPRATRFSVSPASLPIVYVFASVCVLVCVCAHNQTWASLLGRRRSWRCPCTIILPERGLSSARLRLRFFRAPHCWHTFLQSVSFTLPLSRSLSLSVL